jgi:hypothetical protein|nr:hypothetical protein [Neorhizobium tomejilense]
MLNKLLEINFDTPSAKAFDWSLSLVTLAVGLWCGWYLWIVVGALACVASWYRPLTRLQQFVRGIFIRKARQN